MAFCASSQRERDLLVVALNDPSQRNIYHGSPILAQGDLGIEIDFERRNLRGDAVVVSWLLLLLLCYDDDDDDGGHFVMIPSWRCVPDCFRLYKKAKNPSIVTSRNKIVGTSAARLQFQRREYFFGMCCQQYVNFRCTWNSGRWASWVQQHAWQGKARQGKAVVENNKAGCHVVMSNSNHDQWQYMSSAMAFIFSSSKYVHQTSNHNHFTTLIFYRLESLV